MNADAMSSDDLLERRIEAARLRMVHAKSPSLQRHWFGEMQRLIAQRSPEQVARMEEDRGLRT